MLNQVYFSSNDRTWCEVGVCFLLLEQDPGVLSDATIVFAGKSHDAVNWHVHCSQIGSSFLVLIPEKLDLFPFLVLFRAFMFKWGCY